MAIFRFALQPLLEQRAGIEETQRHALLSARHALARAQDTLLSLQAELGRTSREFDGQLDPAGVRRKLLEIELVNAAIARQQAVANAARDAASGAETGYVAARRERLRLQALRDRSYAAFLAGEELREADDYDEANARPGTIPP